MSPAIGRAPTIFQPLERLVGGMRGLDLRSPIIHARTVATRFARDRAGVAVITFALAVPVLAGLVGVAVDYSTWSSQVARLQSAADAAALAAAREISVAAPDQTRIEAVGEAVVRASGAAQAGRVRLTATMVQNRSGVQITLTQSKTAIMSRLVTPALTDITVTATAVASGTRRLCVLGLDPEKSNTINLDGEARITANGCTVASNSRSTKGVSVKGSAVVAAQLICSVGGFEGGGFNFSGQRMTDCPVTADPLADRPPPAVGPCTSSRKLVITSSRTLSPGTYCEGIEIKGNGTRVDLSPGIYVIKDGNLKVDDTAALHGRNVGFYFTGHNAAFDFVSSATVNLGAPRDGPMAGILFFGDRNAPDSREYKITSDNARTLLGTIYLPRGFLTVDSKNTVADQSAYTAIVTQRIDLKHAPNLVLNTNYSATDVPVADGIARASTIRLID
jgi:Flp pilus assembly protein TadG